MNTFKRFIAVTEWLLLLPACLFMTALVVRGLQPQQNQAMHSAQQIVTWYARRPWTLWVLLISLPLVVLVIGCAALLRTWIYDVELRRVARHLPLALRAHTATLFVAAATLTAGVILMVAVLHMLAN